MTQRLRYIIGSLAFCLSIQPLAVAEQCEVKSYFSPLESIESITQTQLLAATSSVKLALFGLTNPTLANILIQRQEQGISVDVVMDKRQSTLPNSLVESIQQHGIPVTIKQSSQLLHHKYAVIDDQVVVIGSWNWSRSADSQDNSAIIISGCPGVVNRFIANFKYIKQREVNLGPDQYRVK